MRRWLLGLAILSSALIGIVLGALNPESVSLDLVLFDWQASLGTVVAMAAGSGIFLGFVFAAGLLLPVGRSRRVQREKTSEASKSLTNA